MKVGGCTLSVSASTSSLRARSRPTRGDARPCSLSRRREAVVCRCSTSPIHEPHQRGSPCRAATSPRRRCRDRQAGTALAWAAGPARALGDDRPGGGDRDRGRGGRSDVLLRGPTLDPRRRAAQCADHRPGHRGHHGHEPVPDVDAGPAHRAGAQDLCHPAAVRQDAARPGAAVRPHPVADDLHRLARAPVQPPAHGRRALPAAGRRPGGQPGAGAARPDRARRSAEDSGDARGRHLPARGSGVPLLVQPRLLPAGGAVRAGPDGPAGGRAVHRARDLRLTAARGHRYVHRGPAAQPRRGHPRPGARR